MKIFQNKTQTSSFKCINRFLAASTCESLNTHTQLAETGRQFKLSWRYCMGKLSTSARTAVGLLVSTLCFICCICPTSQAVAVGMKLEGSLPACHGCCSGDGTLMSRDLLKHLPVWAEKWHFPSLAQQNMFSNYKLNTNCESVCFPNTKEINTNAFNKLFDFFK